MVTTSPTVHVAWTGAAPSSSEDVGSGSAEDRDAEYIDAEQGGAFQVRNPNGYGNHGPTA